MSKTTLYEGTFADNEKVEILMVQRQADGYVLSINGQPILKTDDAEGLSELLEHLNLTEGTKVVIQ